ncbi:hypothetical protein FDUTEX481_05881 [Tolypothrix sp. PCC 7601]|nr:hypothetical protein FDUTEX481_05881 [Tolypothrix sp. PCC 7601]
MRDSKFNERSLLIVPLSYCFWSILSAIAPTLRVGLDSDNTD